MVLAFNQRDGIDEFVKGDFDLVLLCHSIPSTPENGWRALSGSTHCSLRLFPSRRLMVNSMILLTPQLKMIPTY